MDIDTELEQEHLLLDVTEMISELMDAEGVSRAELAARLGTTKSHVTQILAGSRNLTLRTLSDIYVALGYRFIPAAKPVTEPYAEYLRTRTAGGLAAGATPNTSRTAPALPSRTAAARKPGATPKPTITRTVNPAVKRPTKFTKAS